ncbi:MAG: SLC13 family permease [Acidobacteriota bacterium]|jgi:di/tricarboxylate transporter|nr:SLC13 family permease [Acidobacteriota bacterium]
MAFEFWYTLILLMAMTVILIREWIDIELTVVTVLLLLVIGGVINVKEAVRGFSNAGVISIGLLFMLAGAMQSSGLLPYLNRLILGNSPAAGLRRKLVRLLFPVTLISAFMNNTPVVAMLIPSIKKWCQEHNISVSHFLLPLSYAAILGGMCTLIGTSTNLIIHGLLIENGYKGLDFFEISRIGIPAALFGLAYLLLGGYRLLPQRREPISQLNRRLREFVVEMKVGEGYAGIGRSVEAAGLRHLQGLFLFQIQRGDSILAPARPDETICDGDRLFFTGIPETIIELQRVPGLQPAKTIQFNLGSDRPNRICTFEAVIPASSALVGKKVRDSDFRGRYGAVILAIHRGGERIENKIGNIVLHPGDALLVLADHEFSERWPHASDFYLVSPPKPFDHRHPYRKWITGGAFLSMVVLSATGILPLVLAAASAAVVLSLSGCVSAKNVSMDWRVLIIIASMFGIAAAMQNSGLAEYFAWKIVVVGRHFGSFGVLCGVYLLTSLFNTVITSNATSVLFFPIAISAAGSVGADVHPFALAVIISAAASFASPISYQTNLMVYGPGGYRFSDYLKLGIPLQLLIAVIALGLIHYFYL